MRGIIRARPKKSLSSWQSDVNIVYSLIQPLTESGIDWWVGTYVRAKRSDFSALRVRQILKLPSFLFQKCVLVILAFGISSH